MILTKVFGSSACIHDPCPDTGFLMNVYPISEGGGHFVQDYICVWMISNSCYKWLDPVIRWLYNI